MIGQIFVGETFRPDRIAGDEDRDVVHEPESGFERAAGIEPRRFFGTDRQIIDHDFGGRIFQLGDDLLAGGFFFERAETCGADRGRAMCGA